MKSVNTAEKLVAGYSVADGIQAVEAGNTALGMSIFSHLGSTEKSPLALSYEAFCIAKQHHAYQKAFILCNKALQLERSHPLIYLNLGRIYLASGSEAKAAQAFRRGLRLQQHPQLLNMINLLCKRRPRAFPFLDRSNPLNIISGKLLAKLF